jgi:hypothetical protein
VKNFQATGAASSPQRRTSSTSKHIFLKLFSIFCYTFLPKWSLFADPTESPDPDPIHLVGWEDKDNATQMLFFLRKLYFLFSPLQMHVKSHHS